MSEYIKQMPQSSFLKWEVDSNYSRDDVVIAATAGVITEGTVLGKVTASGKYMPLNPTATDGTQIACAIALGETDATLADAVIAAVTRMALISEKYLSFPATITAAQKTKALADLLAVGLKNTKTV